MRDGDVDRATAGAGGRGTERTRALACADDGPRPCGVGTAFDGDHEVTGTRLAGATDFMRVCAALGAASRVVASDDGETLSAGADTGAGAALATMACSRGAALAGGSSAATPPEVPIVAGDTGASATWSRCERASRSLALPAGFAGSAAGAAGAGAPFELKLECGTWTGVVAFRSPDAGLARSNRGFAGLPMNGGADAATPATSESRSSFARQGACTSGRRRRCGPIAAISSRTARGSMRRT